MPEPIRADGPERNEVPYLRVISGLSNPRPQPAAAAQERAGRAARATARPAPSILDADSRPASSRKSFAGVSWPLWAILGVSLIFLGSVRIYAHRMATHWAQTAAAAQLPVIVTHSPEGSASAGALRLRWDDFGAAYEYRLRITSAGGALVFEGPVQTPAWSPPNEALPALAPGEYLWQVEAVDPQGNALARSNSALFRIAN
jgi:hypothetical protein